MSLSRVLPCVLLTAGLLALQLLLPKGPAAGRGGGGTVSTLARPPAKSWQKQRQEEDRIVPPPPPPLPPRDQSVNPEHPYHPRPHGPGLEAFVAQTQVFFPNLADAGCPNCHLNQSCFSYGWNVWRPSRCPTVQFTKSRLDTCLDEVSLFLMGDSRIRQMSREVVALADLDGKYEFTNKFWDAKRTAKLAKVGELVSSGALIEKGVSATLKSEGLATSANITVPMAQVMNNLLVREDFEDVVRLLSRQRGRRKFLVLGGNAPCTVKLPRTKGEDWWGPRLEKLKARVQSMAEKARALLRFIKEARTPDMEVIFYLDLLPVIHDNKIEMRGDANLSEEEYETLVSWVKAITKRRLFEFRKEFPFVTVWDSHLYANEAFVEICREEDRKVEDEEISDPNLEGVPMNTKKMWNCRGSYWHPGRLYQRQVAQMLLNHVCNRKT